MMKRKAKQKKPIDSSTSHSQSEFDSSPKLDGPRTRSSNEHLEQAKSSSVHTIPLSDSSIPTRGRPNRNGSESDLTGISSLGGKGSARGRRSRTNALPSSQPQAAELQPYLPLGSQNTPLLDLKEGLDLPSSISHDYEQEDAAAPELVAIHDLSVSSTPSTFVEPRHFVDKNDVNALHNQRRLNKRELKALLKQTKKTRATLDENILATMEQLADRLKDGCAIDLHPAPPRPVQMASPPPMASTPSSPVKRGPIRGRGGRKSRGGRRGGAKLGTEIANQAPPPTPIPASWVPLILPYRSPTSNDSCDTNLNPLRSHFTPWLNQLSEARVHRFTVSMRHILSQHFVSESALTSYPIVRPDSRGGTASKSMLDSAFPHSTHPIFISESNASTGSVATMFPQSPAAVLSNSAPQLRVGDPVRPPQSHSSSSRETSEISPGESHPITTTPASMARSSQAELKDVSASSYPSVTPTYRPRGRGRGRRFHRSPALFGRGSAARASYQNVGTTVGTVSTVSIPRGSNFQGPVSAKPRVSRELRGLVTWDAVMAQQRRQQEQERLGANSGADTKVQGATDALLAVAHDMIAAATVEEDSAASRTRRTRQSSGSAFSQSGPSTFHSDTGSVVTASGSAALEMNYRPKTADHSSTARSGLSTESSSVSSELFTSNLPGFEHAEEQSVSKPSKQSPVPVALRQSTKVEHKETYMTSEPRTASPHSVLHSCEEPASSSLDLVKYSPISTDQDPDVSHTADVDVLQDKTYERNPEFLKRVGPQKRRGRKQSRHPAQAPALLESALAVASDKSESMEETAVSGVHYSSDLLTTVATVSNIGKRKRQLMHSTPPTMLSDSATAAVSADNDDWGVVHSADEAITTAAPHAPSTGLRRTTGSRSAALPPRKRYKVNIDSTATVQPPSSQTSVESSTNILLDSFVESKPNGNSPLSTSAGDSTNGLGVIVSLSSCSTSIPTEPVKKRGRGRPSRRGGVVTSAVRTTGTTSAPSPLRADASVVLIDRPKREAAAIGFASLVAANLNNSMTQAGSGPSMDSPTRRPSATETPSSTNLPPVADASSDSVQSITSVPSTPRGRGRPPRSKAPGQALSRATATDSSSEVASSVSRRKRTATVLPSERSYSHLFRDASPASGQSEIKADSDITVGPPAKKKSVLSTSPGTSVQHKLTEIAENGDGSAGTPTEVPWKVFVDRLSNKTLTPSRNGDSHKDSSDLDSVHAEHLINQLVEPLPSVQPLTVASKAPTTKRGRKGRPRLQDQLPALNIHKVVTDTSLKEVRALAHPSDTSNLTTLPGRISLFRGHLLTDPVTLGTNPSAPCKGPLCDLFLRFLNEPDPSDPTCRLAAPIVYLPTPEKNPEFYRFVISSYSSGSGFRIRFSEMLLRRLFTATDSPSDKTVTTNAADEAVFDVEFPSLCLASVAKRLYDQASLQTNGNDLADWLHAPNGLTESELACVPLDANDTENCLPLLDAAIESVLTVWESFAGRRSWLGRRLLRLRAVYASVRSECALSIANDYGLIVPPLKATAVLNLPYCKPLGPGTKKKSDRRALERGAEVIRCLCGFRVEGGHVMVQCDRCASWQHLPCLWWALNKAIECRTTTPTVRSLCEAALAAAQAAGSGYLSELVGSGVLPVAGGPTVTTKSDGSELPYFCPVCLDLSDLTLEYPRSLSAAMAMDDLTSVFSLQETIVEGEHEFWSLSSPDGVQQIRTDDYAFINRTWLRFSQVSSSMTPTNRADTKQADQGLAAAQAQPIRCAYDRVVIRIYRLWKDSSGRPWLEGGLFLRPYDVVQPEDPNSEKNFAQCRLWHHREVIYDEASRLVLPLAAWHGRCVVLCPSAYRAGRPADLLSATEAIHLLASDAVDVKRSSDESICSHAATKMDEVFFVCDKLFERTPDSGAVGYRFDEISPGYLKVNMRPYCFFRKPDVPGFGRPNLQRQYTAAQLLEFDRADPIASQVPQEEKSTATVKPNTECGVINPSSASSSSSSSLSSASEKPKGEKLARLVDWLERKRRQDAKAVESKLSIADSSSSDVSVSATSASTAVDGPLICAAPLRSSGSRGRPPRGSRGRGRPPRTATVLSVQTHPSDLAMQASTEQTMNFCSTASSPCSSGFRQSQVSPAVPETCEVPKMNDTQALLNTDPGVHSALPHSEPLTAIVSEVQPEPTVCEMSSEALITTTQVHQSSAISDSPLGQIADVHSASSDETDTAPSTHAIENPNNLVSDPIQSPSGQIACSNKTVLSTELPAVDDSRPEVLLKQSLPLRQGSCRIRERPTARRKCTQTRKRTTSESKPPRTPLLVGHDSQHFLSDSEITELPVQTQLTVLQETVHSDTRRTSVSSVTTPTKCDTYKTLEPSAIKLTNNEHETTSPITIEYSEIAVNKTPQEHFKVGNVVPSSPSEECVATTMLESSVDSGGTPTPNRDVTILGVVKVSESQFPLESEVVDMNDDQKSITTTESDDHLSGVVPILVESPTVVDENQSGQQEKYSQSATVTEQLVIDQTAEPEVHRSKVATSPPQHACENSEPLVSAELTSNPDTKLFVVSPSSPIDLSHSAISCDSPPKRLTDFDVVSEVDAHLSDAEATAATTHVPSPTTSADDISTDSSAAAPSPTSNLVSDEATEKIVQGKATEERSSSIHGLDEFGSGGGAASEVPISPESCPIPTCAGNLSVCDEYPPTPAEIEQFTVPVHSSSSPVSVRVSHSSDASPTNETQSHEEVDTCLPVTSPIVLDTTVDPDSTPILDEPGSDSRFDPSTTDTGQIKPSIVGCLSDTASALLFPSITEFGPVREESAILQPDSRTSNPGDRSPHSTRQSEESSDKAHRYPMDSTNEPARSHSRSQPKDSQSDSRHSSTHSDRTQSNRYQTPSSDHHHSHPHHHHHRQYSRDPRDRSPASSARRSSSSGVGGGSRTHSHHSPSAYRNEARRKDVSRDYNHRRSPSDSPRSSASYHHHSYKPPPHYYHDHPHRYRHHSRKESTRPRDQNVSSMRVGPESSSSSSGFRSSQRDHDPVVGTRNS